MKSKRVTAVLFVALAAIALPAAAHHSTSMFERDKKVTVVGKIKEVQWTNPHVAIYIEEDLAQNAKEGDKPVVWVSELTSPGNLARLGWKKSAFKVGDKVTAEIHPLRSGKRGGWLGKITLTDTGQSFVNDIFAQEKANLK